MTDKHSQHNWSCLVGKFIDNTCTIDEFRELLAKVEQESDKEELSRVLKLYWDRSKDKEIVNDVEVDWETKFTLLMEDAKLQTQDLPIEHFRKKSSKKFWAAAASLIFVLSVAGYFLMTKKSPESIAANRPTVEIAKDDISPGKNIATLTLADGSVIILDSAQNGTLTKQGGIKVIKIGDGQLSFNGASAKSAEVVYNTISTPRGGQYQIQLADGSSVWLNAASSLKFPTAFAGNERTVVLSGEGYFEVAKNNKMPFNVIANGIRVDVLGTHFNVNTYNDENTIATTLLEGSVKVTNQATAGKKSEFVIIKPGQQAKLNGKREMEVVNNANVEQAVAWKNGQFQFDNQDIGTIMRQVSRWYDVDILYRGPVPRRYFTGKISRYSNASQLIEMLKYAGINLSLEGKKIVVAP